MDLSTGVSEKIVFNALEIVQIEWALDHYDSYTWSEMAYHLRRIALRLKIIDIDQLSGYSRLSNL